MEGTDLPNEITDGDDQFVYVRDIGGGAFGTVCIYRETTTQKEYAVKVDPKGQSCLLKECQFLRDYKDQLTKVPIYKSHSLLNDGRRYLVMQLLRQSVDEFITEQEEMDLDYDLIISEIAVQMFDALCEIH